MRILKGLRPGLVLDENFRMGVQETIDAGAYLVEPNELGLGREIPLDPLHAVVKEGTQRFAKRAESDAWLAPRVHATIRLTRREAADKRIWSYLTVVEFPEYTRWRWRKDEEPGAPVPQDRFLGEDSKNALARLWWAAELTRNGSDYRPTIQALSNSRFGVVWQSLDAVHHRAAALAAGEFLTTFDGKGVTTTQGEKLAKAFNLALRTLSLDALWDNPAADAEAIREWCRQPVDETKFLGDTLPVGPDESPTPSEAVAAVRLMLDRLATNIKLSAIKSYRPSARRRGGDEEQEVEEPRLVAPVE